MEQLVIDDRSSQPQQRLPQIRPTPHRWLCRRAVTSSIPATAVTDLGLYTEACWPGGR